VCNTHTSSYSNVCDESWHWKGYMHNLNTDHEWVLSTSKAQSYIHGTRSCACWPTQNCSWGLTYMSDQVKDWGVDEPICVNMHVCVCLSERGMSHTYYSPNSNNIYGDVWSYMCLLCGDPILLVSNCRGSIQQADDLLALHNCQTKVGNYTKTSNTARQLLGLSSQIINWNKYIRHMCQYRSL